MLRPCTLWRTVWTIALRTVEYSSWWAENEISYLRFTTVLYTQRNQFKARLKQFKRFFKWVLPVTDNLILITIQSSRLRDVSAFRNYWLYCYSSSVWKAHERDNDVCFDFNITHSGCSENDGGRLVFACHIWTPTTNTWTINNKTRFHAKTVLRSSIVCGRSGRGRDTRRASGRRVDDNDYFFTPKMVAERMKNWQNEVTEPRVEQLRRYTKRTDVCRALEIFNALSTKW